MGKTRGAYTAEYPVGSRVRIASREELATFMREWHYHNPLQPDQLQYAGRVTTVRRVGFYHGGDELYLLTDIPGTWHEENLASAEPATPDDLEH